MDVKRVWFVCHYSMPPKYEMRVKTLRFAHYLGLKGIDCTIFSASTIHNTDILYIKKNIFFDFNISEFKLINNKNKFILINSPKLI